MKSIQNIFSATLIEHKSSPKLPAIISDLTFELSKKKIQRLKDDSNIQARLGELFELYTRALENEGQSNVANIDAIISGLIKAASHDKEDFLYKTIYEKEQLEKSITKQKESIKNNILGTFTILEKHIQKLDDSLSSKSLQALSDAKLRGVEMLGILKETTSEALLTTLEKTKDIEDTTFQITKNITYQAINEGEFSKQRFIEITKNILEVVIEIADEDQSHAKDLLHGSIRGTKEGMIKAIDKFKNDLKFAPEELEELLYSDLSAIKKELLSVEDDFVSMLENLQTSSNGISKQIICDILETEFNNSFAKIKRASTEAREILSEKIENLKDNSSYLESDFIKKAGQTIEELEKSASAKVESLKNFEFENEKAQKAAAEAKRLGNHAWEVAKGAVESALKGAKDAINKKK